MSRAVDRAVGTAGLRALVVAFGLLWAVWPAVRGETPSPPMPPAPALRLVSLLPSVTELVAALGWSHALVGVSSYCNHPPEIASLPRVGGLDLDLERIVALRPTHVLDGNGMHRAWRPTLARLGVPVIDLSVHRLDDVPLAAASLAAELGNPGRAGPFVESWHRESERLRVTRQGRPRPRCYLEVWDHPPQAAGRESFLGQMLEVAGGENIIGGGGTEFPLANMEHVVLANPDIVFLLYPGADQQTLARRPGWAGMRAVVGRRVVPMPWDPFVRPGPRALRATAYLAAVLDALASDDHRLPPVPEELAGPTPPGS